ncbi:E3 ubiquitin-protein ligase TRIM21-like [Xyrichtys novacula]|uniref:E3 ubiquitin-protein ligase TRIM21-like n=1 Tax=Xyrichtys novacula TaxID=13765 RepID=A0AAV1HLI6_XYRNO|nr:E3 ubiquitin-protein ligase TRIM21-like [Xyrichtys novacula]
MSTNQEPSTHQGEKGNTPEGGKNHEEKFNDPSASAVPETLQTGSDSHSHDGAPKIPTLAPVFVFGNPGNTIRQKSPASENLSNKTDSTTEDDGEGTNQTSIETPPQESGSSTNTSGDLNSFAGAQQLVQNSTTPQPVDNQMPIATKEMEEDVPDQTGSKSPPPGSSSSTNTCEERNSSPDEKQKSTAPEIPRNQPEATTEVDGEGTKQTSTKTPPKESGSSTNTSGDLSSSAGSQQPLQNSTTPQTVDNQMPIATKEMEEDVPDQTVIESPPQQSGSSTNTSGDLNSSAGAQQLVQNSPTPQTVDNQMPIATKEIEEDVPDQTGSKSPPPGSSSSTNTCEERNSSPDEKQKSTAPEIPRNRTDATTEVDGEETKQTSTETPPQESGSSTNTSGVDLNSSAGAQQPVQNSPTPQTVDNQRSAATTEIEEDVTDQTGSKSQTQGSSSSTNTSEQRNSSPDEKQKSTTPETPRNQTDATTEIDGKGTKQTSTKTPPKESGSSTNTSGDLSFSAGAQQPVQNSPTPQTVDNQTSAATTKVEEDKRDHTATKTPPKESGSSTNTSGDLSSSAGSQQPVQNSPTPQPVDNQRSAATTEMEEDVPDQTGSESPWQDSRIFTKAQQRLFPSPDEKQPAQNAQTSQTVDNQTSVATKEMEEDVTDQTGSETPTQGSGISTNAQRRLFPSPDKKQQHQRKNPEVDIILKDHKEDMKEETAKTRDEYTGAPGEVACDICTENKLKALKSCLMCLISYCSTHLKNHSSTKRFKGHKLVQPVENLDDRACLQHGRPLELFSRKSGRCICALCMEEDKEGVVTTEEEWKGKRARLDDTMMELRKKIEKRTTRTDEINVSLMDCEDQLNNEMEDIDAVFGAVLAIVEEARAAALQPIQDRRKAMEEEAKHIEEKLRGEIQQLEKTFYKLKEISELEDHILFLQGYPFLQDLDSIEDCPEVELNTSLSFGTMKEITTTMMESIQKEVEKLTPIELQRITKFKAVDVKLDPATAHPRLALSEDGKEVRDSGENQKVADSPKRFDVFGSILGLDKLPSWEVLLGDNGYWVAVHYEEEKYAAMTAPPVPLYPKKKPQKVGVFVDYEEGVVSFYDVRANSHIYSFTKCSFNDKIFPYFSPHVKKGSETPIKGPLGATNAQRRLFPSPDEKPKTKPARKSVWICSCGWHEHTTYDGLKIHQDMNGCTQVDPAVDSLS